ncbi:MAG: hypothetical protein JNM10_09480 [Planctomycetia bacterium]|nr:hypothetical protein [Planctomycetia bacterium]
MDPSDALGLEPAFDALGLDPATATPAAARRALHARLFDRRVEADDEGAREVLASHAAVAAALGPWSPPDLRPHQVLDRIAAGDVDDACAAIDRWAADGDTASLAALEAALRTPGERGPDAPPAVLLALGRGSALADPPRARRLVAAARARALASPDPTVRGAEAEALLRAADDLPIGEGAARRALARVAAMRDWLPDAWGPDHGALLAVLRAQVRPGSSRRHGPLVRYLHVWAPAIVRRVAAAEATKEGVPLSEPIPPPAPPDPPPSTADRAPRRASRRAGRARPPLPPPRRSRVPTWGVVLVGTVVFVALLYLLVA